jgi:hypothetical protein
LLILSRRHLARNRLARVAVEEVQAGVGGDPIEPRAKRRATLEALALAPGAQEGLLHQVLRILERAEHAVAMHLQFAPVALDQRAKRRLVARTRSGDNQSVLGFALHSFAPTLLATLLQYRTYAAASQMPFQPSAERIATILTVINFRPQGENRQQ